MANYFKVLSFLLICYVGATVADTPPDLSKLLNDEPKQALELVQQQLDANFSTPKPNNITWQKLEIIQLKALIKLGDYQQAKQVAARLIALAEGVNQGLYQAEVFFHLAEIKQQEADYSAAKKALERALDILPVTEDTYLHAEILGLFSTIYRFEARYADSLTAAGKALAIYRAQNDLMKQANMLNLLGVIHDYMGDYQSALQSHEASLEIQRKLGNQQGISNSLYNMGELYRDLNKLSLAQLYFQQTLTIDREKGNPVHIANSLGKLAQVSLALNDSSSARRYVEEALELVREIGAKSDLAWQLSNLARVEMAEGQFAQAHSHAQEGLLLAVEVKAKRTEHLVRMALVDIASAQQKHAETLLALAPLLGDDALGKQERSALLKRRADVYKALGDFQAATADLEQHSQLQQEVYAGLDAKQAERMKFNVEFARQANALQLAQKDQALQAARLDYLALERTSIALSLVLVLSLSLFGLWRFRQKQKLSEVKASLVAQSLAQKKRFFADVSHELRTPLTGLKLIVEALRYRLEPDVDAAYQRLDNKLLQLDTLIKDIYQYTQLDSGVIELNLQQCEFNHLLEDIVRDFRPLAEAKALHLSLQLPEQRLTLDCDAMRLRQIISNLLKNSIAYTDAGGVIELLLVVQAQGWLLVIDDSKPGVPDAQLAKLFERLFRGSSARSRDAMGSGLGMSISRQLVQLHGWKIAAQHSPLGGLRVVLQS
ncbi:tetratricopeptide repeat protein [Pseudoalteromonas fenneropenaei]|uniref:histidine kinase n=1 Tax=Pseudoalteromonas fenneropenaei TaxID=1737459 RepID=A0ABV7CIU5_9GAMM